MKIIEGHTLKEYMAQYGHAYQKGDLWDFDPEDLQNGAIEDDGTTYWLINNRLYEINQ